VERGASRSGSGGGGAGPAGRAGSTSGVWSANGPGAPPSEAANAPAASSPATPETRAIKGKTFYRNGETWIDSAIQGKPDLKRVEIKFGSDEYFALLDRHPDFRPWLARGKRVQFVVGEMVYVVTE
jgi:hypothetical protein